MSRIAFLLDKEWKFAPETPELATFQQVSHADSYGLAKAGGVKGPGGVHWEDGDWRVLDLPHDYFSETPIGPENLHSHGYHARGNGWYRKTFRMEEDLRGRQFLLCLEGVAVKAEVYFNGSLVGRSFSAYSEWAVDLTDRMHFGEEPNVLAVYFDGMHTEGWWYEGAGIYRHVRLFVKDLCHIAHNGLFVKPQKVGEDWFLDVEVTVENTGYDTTDYDVKVTVSREGETVATALDTGWCCEGDATHQTTRRLQVENPRLWDIDDPALYHAAVQVLVKGEPVDEEETDFGFRTIRFDADKGFFLNDRPLKLKGVCCHQDHAGVGAAVPDSVQEYRIRRLKDMGANAYRCAHNLPAREILDACDRLGMLVMDENRRFECSPETVGHVETMVRRDRNHPSVILYSLFNEENLQSTAEGQAIFRRLKRAVQRLDDSRPVTGAMNGGFLEPAGVAPAMDVVGVNYSLESIPAFHEMYPHLPLFGSENDSALSTRGCYASDREGAQVLQDYGDEVVPWGSTIWQAWDFTRSHDYMGGIFIWTGFDYRGEPLPFGWPSCSSQFGLLDTCGFEKEGFYQAKACFSEQPFVHIAPHWNWEEGQTVRVQVVTNG
ncbi:MAG: beta-galactosidase, partial [Clostridia bacterium]|nr:beta-galactosidase [Clostridia bacterium]